MEQLLADGRATHPWLGAATAEVSQDVADRFGTTSGLFVQSVTAGGPAARAGLRVGDVLTGLDGQPANSVNLAWVLVSAEVGSELAVDYVRDGQPASTTVTLAEQP